MTTGSFQLIILSCQPSTNKAFSTSSNDQLANLRIFPKRSSCRTLSCDVSLNAKKKKKKSSHSGEADVLPIANYEKSITWVTSTLETLQAEPLDKWSLKEFPEAFSAIRIALEFSRSGEATFEVDGVEDICAQVFRSLYSHYAGRFIKNSDSTASQLVNLVVVANEFNLLLGTEIEVADLAGSLAEVLCVMRDKGLFSVAERSKKQLSRDDARLLLNSCVGLGYWNRALDEFVTKYFFLELASQDVGSDEYKELSEALFAAFRKMKPPSVVRILKAMGYLRRKVRTQSLSGKRISLFVRDILQAVRDEVARGNRAWLLSPCVSYFCWTIAKCEHVDLSAMNTIISARLKALKLQDKQISATELACLLHSTALLTIQCPKVVKFAVEFLKSGGVQTIDQLNGTRILWGMCVHGALTEAQFYRLVGLMISNNKENPKANTTIMPVVAQCYVFLKVSGKLSKKPGLPYSKKCKGFIKQASSTRKGMMHSKVSRFQKAVHRHLDEGLKLKVKSEESLLDGHVLTDFHLQDSNIVVEADGPMHYATNEVNGKPYLLGKTALRNKLLELAGFKVLSVPQHQWEKMKYKNRTKWLKDAILNMQKIKDPANTNSKKRKTKKKKKKKNKTTEKTEVK